MSLPSSSLRFLERAARADTVASAITANTAFTLLTPVLGEFDVEETDFFVVVLVDVAVVLVLVVSPLPAPDLVVVEVLSVAVVVEAVVVVVVISGVLSDVVVEDISSDLSLPINVISLLSVSTSFTEVTRPSSTTKVTSSIFLSEPSGFDTSLRVYVPSSSSKDDEDEPDFHMMESPEDCTNSEPSPSVAEPSSKKMVLPSLSLPVIWSSASFK